MKRMIGLPPVCRFLMVATVFLAASAALAGMIPAAKLAEADNGFAFDLLKQIAMGLPGRNIFISPYSASSALQMLGNGAAGRTKAEIERVLGTKDFPENELNGACRALNQSLLSQTNVILDVANSIWLDKGFELKTNFVSTNREFFRAEVGSVDFETPEAAGTINRWAEKSTRGKISHMVTFPFPAYTEVILANATYFKGKWAEAFDKNQTHPRYFYLPNGIIKQTPMMSQRGKFRYQDGNGFQAVELPYAEGGLQMIVFLPATNSSPAKMLAHFSGSNWDRKIRGRFFQREGTVVFPKFKLNYEIDLNQPLQGLGMRQAFIRGAANFSAMGRDPLFISLVKQKSYLDVNEEGTEAAAVTTVTVRASAMMRPRPPFEMIVDRPFLFVISEKKTHAILFMGIITDPTLPG